MLHIHANAHRLAKVSKQLPSNLYRDRRLTVCADEYKSPVVCLSVIGDTTQLVLFVVIFLYESRVAERLRHFVKEFLFLSNAALAGL